ncbi:hypothetical protein HJD18_00135 [Thermoleophilia bacterium SCSIO 60948]|nr:hypothetical protein HJD18_00135 [Thermoleophilia bacterium SCSIO 60948]
MSSTLEGLGPILGLIALIGLVVMAFLIIGQGRELRRLRDWAGRAPERADEAAEASLAAQEARSGSEAADAGRSSESRGARFRGAVGERYGALDSRLPFDGRILLGVLALIVVALIALFAFGVFGGSSESQGGGGGEASRPAPTKVAVLNATQSEASDGTPVAAREGIADAAARQLVNPPRFKPTEKTNAPAGEEDSVVMFDAPGDEAAAERLASDLSGELGDVGVESMSQEVRDIAAGAPLALLIGQDDADAEFAAGLGEATEEAP